MCWCLPLCSVSDRSFEYDPSVLVRECVVFMYLVFGFLDADHEFRSMCVFMVVILCILSSCIISSAV